jgi:broad specificity phosphatase PhoE
VEILFVRHGQPEWARDDVPQMDPALTELGLKQAELVAERLCTARAGLRGADEIISSPARRARETAAPLARRLGMTPVVVDDLVELRLPDWTHLSLAEVANEFRNARAREPQAWWEGVPGGESFRLFFERVQRGILGLLEERGVCRCPEEQAPIFSVARDLGRVVIVGHGGMNAVAMTVLLGLPSVPWEWERFTLSHAGLMRLKAIPLGRGFIFSLRSFNDCEHLPRDMRSA